jgi:hypothetical protein
VTDPRKNPKPARAVPVPKGYRACPAERLALATWPEPPRFGPADAVPDGLHLVFPRFYNPYGPGVVFERGRPVKVQRHAAFPVTPESFAGVLARFGWRAEVGEFRADFSIEFTCAAVRAEAV